MRLSVLCVNQRSTLPWPADTITIHLEAKKEAGQEMARLDTEILHWQGLTQLPSWRFICGHCSTTVASEKGWSALGPPHNHPVGFLYICPECRGPVFHKHAVQFPIAAFGKPVPHVPKELNDLFEEARSCTSANAFTAAVLICRKMLMNIAVQEGAKEGLKFIEYVDHLAARGFVPPNGRHWVDHIRKRGNEATHEISLMSETDAKELVGFVEMLLRFIYEFPNLIPNAPP
jgi:hypothetical protein